MNDRRRHLQEVRSQIAEADAEILRVLQRRAHLARRAQELGLSKAPPAMPSRQEVAAKLEALGIGDLAPDAVLGVLREVQAATVAIEHAAKVAFVRPEGGYAELAARTQFGASAQTMGADTTAACLEEVTRRRSDHAVIALECSADGPIWESIEALAASDLFITAKVEVAEVFCLARKEGAESEIDEVFVDGRAGQACHGFLAKLARPVSEVASPRVACEAALANTQLAAVAPQHCAEAMGLTITESNVGDRADVRYRFGVVSARPTQRSGNDTTALLFGVHDQPGALFDVLKLFAERGINLKSIQSRPTPGQRWTYRFHIEVSGHVTDRAVVTAIEEIKHNARFVKVLGSFPAC